MFARFSLVLVFTSIAGVPLWAASSSSAPVPSPTKPVVAIVTAPEMTAAFTTSAALFKAGDLAGGETALFSINRHAPGTAAGLRDGGRALALMAAEFRQHGDAVTAAQLAQAALAQLRQAQLQAGTDKKLAASIDTLMGFVQEHLCGTADQAEVSYQAAMRASPATAQTASSALARLEAGDAAIARTAAKAGAN